jgi:predicted  nucleic acid-binding Zn-ribbon protein
MERSDLPERSALRLDDEPEPPRHTVAWIAVAVLAIAAIAGLCWYGYPTLSQAPAMLAQFPGLQKSVEGVNSRLTDTEARLKDWGSSHQDLQDHVATLEKEMASRFQAARRQARDLSAQVYQRVQTEVAAQTAEIRTRLARIESTSEADRANLAKLQTEVATLRQETAQQAQQLRNVRSDIERDGVNRDRQLVSLNDQVGLATRNVDGLAKSLEVKRVNFEVTRNHSQQIAEGVSLGLTGTDVDHRRVSGWMWVTPDRRTIWLNRQSAQQPVVFYGYQDGKRRELVITNVTRNSATGYVLLPGDGDSPTTASLSKGD